MSPVPTYTVPTNNSDTATEEPKITIALADLKNLLTGNLDNDNIASSAGIGGAKLDLTNTIVNADVKTTAAMAISKLASGSSAQIIVCNASGVPTYITPSGPLNISNAGATDFVYQFNAQVGTTALNTDGVTWTTVASLTVTETGTYAMIGKLKAVESISTNHGLSGRLRQNFSTLDEAECGAGNVGNTGVTCMHIASLTAGDVTAIQGVGLSGGGTITASYGRLFILRLA